MARLKSTFLITVAVLLPPMMANAGLIEITANSEAAGGELGYFVADEDVLASNSGIMQASDFFSYFFSDPGTGITLDTSNVDGDTGFTFFSLISGVWTVTGGSEDSLTDSDLGHAVWIAGASFLSFNSGRAPSYSDVEWSTSDFLVSVPEPGTLVLLGLGLAGIGFSRKKIQNKR